MALKKKNTSVVLPGSIQDLVHTVQQGAQETEAKKKAKEEAEAGKEKLTGSQKAQREYQVIRDSGADSWSLFVDLAKDYKLRGGKLATVYIDADLKKILDRLKSASDVKLPATSILSSIVARFIFDHEEEVKKLIYSQDIF